VASLNLLSLALNPVIDFFPMHGNFLGRIDAQPNMIDIASQHRHGDISIRVVKVTTGYLAID
jgi:hypothetical protein